MITAPFLEELETTVKTVKNDMGNDPYVIDRLIEPSLILRSA